MSLPPSPSFDFPKAYSGPPSPPDRPRKSHRWPKRALIGLALLVFLMLAVYFVLPYLAKHFVAIPQPIPQGVNSQILDNQGNLLATIASKSTTNTVANRNVVPLDQIDPSIPLAVMAAEDHNFRSHGGIDWKGTLRALWHDNSPFMRGGSQGGSTITQQYVKNKYVGNEHTYGRKIHEALVSIKLEQTMTKDQIMEGYLNSIYWGGNVYGIEAACQALFGHDAAPGHVSVAEAAMLAGIIRAPNTYESQSDQAAIRFGQVLDAMAKHNLLPAPQNGFDQPGRQAFVDGLKAKPPTFKRASSQLGISGAHSNAYAVQEALWVAIDQLGSDAVYRHGVNIVTTINPTMQTAAANAAARLNLPSDPWDAIVAIDPATGGVLAMASNQSYDTTEYNPAVLVTRQAGSAMKPFTLAVAIQDGKSLDDRYSGQDGFTIGKPPNTWTVRNYNGEEFGNITLREATEKSVNAVYAHLITEDQPGQVASFSKQAGVTDVLSKKNDTAITIDAVPSLALGTSDVSALGLASAYQTFANNGTHIPPHIVDQITYVANAPNGTASGTSKPPWKYTPPTDIKPPLTPAQANTVTQALQGVIANGTGVAAQIGRPAAGKTGTTDNAENARFVGYTPNLVASVWVGYHDPHRPMRNVRGYSEITGGTLPAQIWHDFMIQATRGLPALSFQTPTPTPTPVPAVTSTTAQTLPATSTTPETTSTSVQATSTSLPRRKPTTTSTTVETTTTTGQSATTTVNPPASTG